MKKIFLCALAAAALTTACNKAEVIDVVGTPAIQFENAFVNNATRAAEDPSYNYEANMFSQFYVWGYMDNTPAGVVFNEELVSANGTAWTYANTQYWLEDHSYTFEAVTATDYADATVNATDADVVTVDFVNTNGTNDLLYATASVPTVTDPSAMTPVELTFNHLLSKVKFTFANGFDNENSTIEVTEVKMTAPKKGNVAVTDKAWTNLAETVTLEFGDVNKGAKIDTENPQEADNERLTIPASKDQEYEVTFKVQLYNGTVAAFEEPKELTAIVSGVALEVGKAYNFKAEINASNILGPDEQLYPIEFTVVAIENWVPADDVATELENTNIAAGESLTLVTNAEINGTVSVAGTLDGAGNTLFAAAEPTNNGLVRPTDGAVVKNVTIDGKGLATTDDKGLRAIYITTGGTYTFDNVVTNDVAYALNVTTEADVVLNVSNSVLEGWSSYGSTTTATFENVQFTVGNYYGTDNKNYSDNDNGLFRPYGTTTLTNCSFADGFIIDLCALAAEEKVTFVNCTYNGAALTAAKITTVFGTDTMAGSYEIK